MRNTWAIEGLEDYVPANIGGASKYAEGWNWGAFFFPGVWSFFQSKR